MVLGHIQAWGGGLGMGSSRSPLKKFEGMHLREGYRICGMVSWRICLGFRAKQDF